MRERWVTFDCYGTLVDWRAGMSDALASVVDERAEQLLEAYHDFEHEVQTESYRPYREVLSESLRRAAAREGIDLADDDVLGRTLPGWPVFADVEQSLGRLRDRGWRLAILSNVDRDLIAGTLTRMPFAFDEVITAEEVRSYKPALRHFEVFGGRTGVGPGQWVHVACSTFHDILPARELSVPSVWVDREGTGRRDPVADVTLRDLESLPQTLERLLAGASAGG